MAEPLEAVLLAHAARYPAMVPQDAVKLLYQNEFGGGHLIADPDRSLTRLRAEYDPAAADPSLPLSEEIGDGMVRVHLRALDPAEYPLEDLNRDFARSAALRQGSVEGFREKLALLEALTAAGQMPFAPGALRDYLLDYERAGYPAVSHSAAYRAAYAPAYRVLLRSTSLALLLREVRDRKAAGLRTLLALDGRCGSGKTTLAADLSRRFGWGVVHLDHFFLRPEQRTPARYADPGGNLDRERLLEEALLPLSRGEDAVYRPFDCHTMDFAAPVTVRSGLVTVVEGVYACHPDLWDLYHLRAFLTVDPAEQLRRLTAREGPDGAAVYRDRWIPLEERYFGAFRIPERCEYNIERQGLPEAEAAAM